MAGRNPFFADVNEDIASEMRLPCSGTSADACVLQGGFS